MTDYERRLESALAKRTEINDQIDFLRLQIKQEKKQAKWAKGSPILKQFKAQWPELTIDNGAGTTYLGLEFQHQQDYEGHLPAGWEFDRHRTDNSAGHATCRIYRYPGIPALLYVTTAIR